MQTSQKINGSNSFLLPRNNLINMEQLYNINALMNNFMPIIHLTLDIVFSKVDVI